MYIFQSFNYKNIYYIYYNYYNKYVNNIYRYFYFNPLFTYYSSNIDDVININQIHIMSLRNQSVLSYSLI